jgi:hypothetical protein
VPSVIHTAERAGVCEAGGTPPRFDTSACDMFALCDVSGVSPFLHSDDSCVQLGNVRAARLSDLRTDVVQSYIVHACPRAACANCPSVPIRDRQAIRVVSDRRTSGDSVGDTAAPPTAVSAAQLPCPAVHCKLVILAIDRIRTCVAGSRHSASGHRRTWRHGATSSPGC